LWVPRMGVCSAARGEFGPTTGESFSGRLWKNISKGGPEDCWPWVGKWTANGYGKISLNGRGVRAHRAVWEDTNGAIPTGRGFHGTVVMHKCDNRACCNPAHLVLGSQSENMKDMAAKGRSKAEMFRCGETNPRARLSSVDVASIRASAMSGAALAREFGCSESTIANIRHRRTRRLG